MGASTPEKPFSTAKRNDLVFVGTRLNTVEQKAFVRLQKTLGHTGYGAQAKTVKEVLRDAMKLNGPIGKSE